MIDVVYYYLKCGSDELRYSVRSAVKNLEVNRIFLVGDKPKWFKETNRSIYVKSNIVVNESNGLGSIPILHMINLIKSGKCPDKFLMFNDDFFIMKPIKEWKDYYRNDEDYMLKCSKNYHYHMRTFRSLSFIGNLNGQKYNLHIPMMLEKKNLIDIIEYWKGLPKRDIDFRTLYGNLYTHAESGLDDVKNVMGETFISTANDTFDGQLGEFIKSQFEEPSFVEMIK